MQAYSEHNLVLTYKRNTLVKYKSIVAEKNKSIIGCTCKCMESSKHELLWYENVAWPRITEGVTERTDARLWPRFITYSKAD